MSRSFREEFVQLGRRLAECRDRMRLTLRVAAERASVNHSTLSTWEQGRAVPTADALARLAAVYGVSIEWLLGYPETIFGIPIRHDWPEGLWEFVMSGWAKEYKLRPWEIGLLAAVGIGDGIDPTVGNWAGRLFNWRLQHGDMTGMKLWEGNDEGTESSKA